jgi:hypothetical protein
MVEAQIPDPYAIWVPSKVNAEWLKGMVRCGVLGDHLALGWHLQDGGWPAEDRTETVIFAAFFKHGFGIPTGSFFRGLLQHYGIELVHLSANSISSISVFIHLGEAYLGGGMQARYFDLKLKDSVQVWQQKWFILVTTRLLCRLVLAMHRFRPTHGRRGPRLRPGSRSRS